MEKQNNRWVARGRAAIEIFATALVAASAFAAAFFLQATNLSEVSSPKEADPWQAEQQEKLQLQAIPEVTFLNYNNLIADWTFLRYLQYFGDDKAREQTGYSLNPIYFDLIIKWDPRFVDIYPFLSTGVSLYAGRPDESVRLIQQGIKSLSPQIDPQSYIVWRYDGIDRLLLLGDIQGSVASHDRGADWAQAAGFLLSSARLRRIAELLRQNPDSTMARFNSWVYVFKQSGDRLAQERAVLEILKLGGRVRETEGGGIEFVPPPVESTTPADGKETEKIEPNPPQTPLEEE